MKKIIKMFTTARGKAYATFALSLTMTLIMCSVAFAGEVGTDFTAIKSALTSKFTVAEVSSLIASVVGATVGFAVLWWGARKLVRSIVSAFKTGKIKF